MKSFIYLLFLSISLLSKASGIYSGPDLKLPSMFTDHMVLQQKQDVAFWGKAKAGEKVTISSTWGATATTVANSKGDWATRLHTPAAGGPYIVTVKSGTETILISDVLVGEVWLASGQSNMEMPLKGWPPTDPIENSAQEIDAANYPNIRLLKVPFSISATALDSFNSEWIIASPETAADLSATAYFFARKLNQELNIPIGIIQASVSGTAAEAWTSAQSLAKMGDFDQSIRTLASSQENSADWFKKWKSQPMPLTSAEWKSISFNDAAVVSPQFDDSAWKSTRLPDRIDLLGTGEFDGAIWFRKEFEIKDISTDYVLHIGAVDDMDATYINGMYVGGLTGIGVYNTPREIAVPKELLIKGKNHIAVRVMDTGGPGLVNGPIQISNTKDKVISLEGEWKSRIVSEIYNGIFYTYDLTADLTARPDIAQFNSNSPTVLYNAMISPIIPFTLKGVIWYQGESNVGRHDQYKRLFPLMIEDWRSRWNIDFPFYFVEIAPFIYAGNQKDKSQDLRNAQRYSLKVPKTGMVTTSDIGNPTNIHPAKKQEVGNRLASIALLNNYGKTLTASGPIFKKTATSGQEISVEFDGVGSGLVAGPNGISGFEIAGKNKVFVKASARIDGNKVIVSHNSVTQPLYVRYAWSDIGSTGLFNKEGWPAATFTSENN